MANITLVDETASMLLAPPIINTNFNNINNELAGFANLLTVSNSSLTLNGVIPAPAKGVEASAIVLTGIAGLLLNLIPSGTATVMSVSNTGEIVSENITTNVGGTSTMGIVNAVEVNAPTVKATGVFDASTASIVYSNTIVQIVVANIGAGATNPIDVSGKQEIMFDADNGGVQLVAGGSDATVNVDTTTLVAGQKINFRLLRKNTTNILKMLNGDATAPLFAKIDFASGYTDIAYTVYPTFNDLASEQSFMECQWVEVSAGQFRLVILNHKNVNNV